MIHREYGFFRSRNTGIELHDNALWAPLLAPSSLVAFLNRDQPCAAPEYRQNRLLNKS
jgi:hypothetical protein